jgi:hypothetical protein
MQTMRPTLEAALADLKAKREADLRGDDLIDLF